MVVGLHQYYEDAWYGGTINSVKITVSQGYFQSGGSSGTTGGGSQT